MLILIQSKCKFLWGNSLTSDIKCVQLLSCNIIFTSCLSPLFLFKGTLKQSHISWETVRQMVVFTVKEWLHLDLDTLLTSSALPQAHTQTETQMRACTLCPNSPRNEDSYTHVHRVWSWTRIPTELCIGSDGVGSFGTGARMSVWPPLTLCEGIPVKGIWGVCPCWALWFPTSVRLVPQRETGEWVGSRNASTVTQSCAWLLCGCKCACMCFFKTQ